MKLVLTVRLTCRALVAQDKSRPISPTTVLISLTKITFILHLFNHVFSKTFEKKLNIGHVSLNVVFYHL